MAQRTATIYSTMNVAYADIRFAVVDVETTGIHPDRDAVVEVACSVVRGGIETQSFSSLIDPGRPIPARASAVHHLTAEHLMGQPPLAKIAPIVRRLCAGAVIVAHNAAFDLAFLPMLRDRPVLCTLRLARHLFPEFDGHANQLLRYALETTGLAGAGAHRALDDARVTAGVLAVLLRRFTDIQPGATIEGLLAFAAAPIIYPALPFGRYRAKPIADVPIGYLRWLRDRDIDADLQATIEAQLALRDTPVANAPATIGASIPMAEI